ncbi:MAG: hypothetical protein ACD_7C00039G0004 [uncultured bacterium]|nr:MAG: hypothetical protein ACD_7C00039G0004 [uncultured bacterium]KKP67728.1 MAG: hypothetical protein UR66_C0011G0004 [Candidatus Moranbacteria bacterium GW2011_GWE1_35_17]KKP72438.1 MAG: hypothetical protein UR65_C0015G0008 [Candidatus Moranbacteria bacterium GW2011_GWE2_35_164]KKP81073.1 MAG: hypothetical protein UR82_C0073G0011 [Candidatus Moranbacteria bacterium GW2011_GWF1_35_5]KKP84149.1 MAG: hypothetical protein UR83_C0026G0012 [Candidatus Moranbacteria bacterium GW2011_GWF2_35_54]HB
MRKIKLSKDLKEIKKRIDKIKKFGHGKSGMCIEVDYFKSSFWLRDDDGIPFQPFVIMFIHKESCFMLKTHMVIPNDKFRIEFFEQLLDVLENNQFLIGKIKVKKQDLFDLFEKTATDLGIRVELSKRLTGIEFAKRDFNQFFK